MQPPDPDQLDLIFRALDQPGSAEQVVRGPHVTVCEEAAVTAFSPYAVVVEARAHGQVRLAPRVVSDWARIQPLEAGTVLLPGFVVHTGPADAGRTVQFVGCRRADGTRIGVSELRPLRPVRVERQTNVYMLGSAGAGLSLVMVIGLAVAGSAFGDLLRGPPGPRDAGPALFPPAAVQTVRIEPEVRSAMHAAYASAVGRDVPSEDARIGQVASTARKHLESWAFFGQLEEHVDAYGTAVGVYSGRDMPEAAAAIGLLDASYATLGPDGPGVYEVAVAIADRSDELADDPSFAGTAEQRLLAEHPGGIGPGPWSSRVIGLHALAVCYYGQNHADRPEFAPYRVHSATEGYCSAMRIPTPAEVAAAR